MEQGIGKNQTNLGQPEEQQRPFPQLSRRHDVVLEDVDKQLDALERLQGRMHSLHRNFVMQQVELAQEQGDAVQHQAMKQMSYLQELQDRQTDWQFSRFRKVQSFYAEELASAASLATVHTGTLPQQSKTARTRDNEQNPPTAAGQSSSAGIPSEDSVGARPVMSFEANDDLKEQLSGIQREFNRLQQEVQRLKVTVENPDTKRASTPQQIPTIDLNLESKTASLVQSAQKTAKEFAEIKQAMGWSPLDEILDQQAEQKVASASSQSGVKGKPRERGPLGTGSSSTKIPRHTKSGQQDVQMYADDLIDEEHKPKLKRNGTEAQRSGMEGEACSGSIPTAVQIGEGIATPPLTKKVRVALGGGSSYADMLKTLAALNRRRKEVVAESMATKKFPFPNDFNLQAGESDRSSVGFGAPKWADDDPPRSTFSLRATFGQDENTATVDSPSIRHKIDEVIQGIKKGQKYTDTGNWEQGLAGSSSLPGSLLTQKKPQQSAPLAKDTVSKVPIPKYRSSEKKKSTSQPEEGPTSTTPGPSPKRRAPPLATSTKANLQINTSEPPPYQTATTASRSRVGGPGAFTSTPASPNRPKPGSPKRPPNFYNVKLSNAPVFLRRTTIRPPTLERMLAATEKLQQRSPQRPTVPESSRSRSPGRVASPPTFSRPIQTFQPSVVPQYVPTPVPIPISVPVSMPGPVIRDTPTVTVVTVANEGVQTLPAMVSHATQMTASPTISTVSSPEPRPRLKADVGVQGSGIPIGRALTKEVGLQSEPMLAEQPKLQSPTSSPSTSWPSPLMVNRQIPSRRQASENTSRRKERFDERPPRREPADEDVEFAATVSMAPPPRSEPPPPNTAALEQRISDWMQNEVLMRLLSSKLKPPPPPPPQHPPTSVPPTKSQVIVNPDDLETAISEVTNEMLEHVVRKEATILCREALREEEQRREQERVDALRRAQQEQEERERLKRQQEEDEQRRKWEAAERARFLEELKAIRDQQDDRLRLEAEERERKLRDEQERLRRKEEEERLKREALEKEEAEQRRRKEEERAERDRKMQEELEKLKEEIRKKEAALEAEMKKLEQIRLFEEEERRRRREMEEEALRLKQVQQHQTVTTAVQAPSDSLSSFTERATMGSSEASTMGITTLSTFISDGEVLTQMYSEGEMVARIDPTLLPNIIGNLGPDKAENIDEGKDDERGGAFGGTEEAKRSGMQEQQNTAGKKDSQEKGKQKRPDASVTRRKESGARSASGSGSGTTGNTTSSGETSSLGEISRADFANDLSSGEVDHLTLLRGRLQDHGTEFAAGLSEGEVILGSKTAKRDHVQKVVPKSKPSDGAEPQRNRNVKNEGKFEAPQRFTLPTEAMNSHDAKALHETEERAHEIAGVRVEESSQTAQLEGFGSPLVTGLLTYAPEPTRINVTAKSPPLLDSIPGSTSISSHVDDFEDDDNIILDLEKRKFEIPSVVDARINASLPPLMTKSGLERAEGFKLPARDAKPAKLPETGTHVTHQDEPSSPDPVHHFSGPPAPKMFAYFPETSDNKDHGERSSASSDPFSLSSGLSSSASDIEGRGDKVFSFVDKGKRKGTSDLPDVPNTGNYDKLDSDNVLNSTMDDSHLNFGRAGWEHDIQKSLSPMRSAYDPKESKVENELEKERSGSSDPINLSSNISSSLDSDLGDSNHGHGILFIDNGKNKLGSLDDLDDSESFGGSSIRATGWEERPHGSVAPPPKVTSFGFEKKRTGMESSAQDESGSDPIHLSGENDDLEDSDLARMLLFDNSDEEKKTDSQSSDGTKSDNNVVTQRKNSEDSLVQEAVALLSSLSISSDNDDVHRMGIGPSNSNKIESGPTNDHDDNVFGTRPRLPDPKDFLLHESDDPGSSSHIDLMRTPFFARTKTSEDTPQSIGSTISSVERR
ncbi:hypothetical protein HK102_004533 [Quaeritorhiza haematococci]|nr:hypothetical protein HK102_004533 [Quaeritorhiza haematococci]